MIRSMLLAVGLLSHLSAAETLLVPEQYPTIQAAINNANYGDAIDVGPGSYDGFSLNASQGAPRSIAIRSREGASKTVIEGNSPNIFYSYYSGNGYSRSNRDRRIHN